jgi:hypothetical protein
MRNKEIDAILKEMAKLYTNIGTDSTEQERDEAKQQELAYIAQIAYIDAEYAARLLHD